MDQGPPGSREVCVVNKPKEIQVLLKVRHGGIWQGPTPVVGQESAASSPKAGLVVAGVGFNASVNHNENYLKTFPLNCPS